MSANVSVALLDRSSGEERTYPSASIVKVSILAALLDRGHPPTARERELARVMIVRSDNDAATALWEAVGGAAGVDAAHARLGLTQTRAAAAWGLTRTTARDQLTLMQAVFGGRPYGYLRSLMRQVLPGQDWGVSAAGGPWALKNGWMPMRDTGLWVVHSVGRAGGRLIAVLSDGHPTKEAGIACVEAAAREAVGGR
ncbi:class A beta-lactamase-related serine hydrolase [Streptomyces sp. NBC_01142]|uniref:serine hydrolase n=1 Tax=Streptomyces sp. NBC_01142 TaxID=2975865 RepID=UPI00225A7F1F|nr:serine hydrolase [Streptomyces sp. NBC_01142]MCX4821865.1 class A beta-lactamase-related serine hydrolase [Streptomyces sp. NBC_01142]